MIDYAAVIERQTRDLLTVIAALFAYAGLKDGQSADTLPRRVYRYMLTILRPAEAAMRRLIVIAARNMTVKVNTGTFPKGLAAKLKSLKSAGETAAESEADAVERIPAFGLIDPLKEFVMPGDRKPFAPRRTSFPRIIFLGGSDPYFPPPYVAPTGEDPIKAAQLFRRLAALRHALETLPKQARRLVRWRARVIRTGQRETVPKPRRIAQLRRGRPPGYRKKHQHLVDRILFDCNYFAHEALDGPDTS